jgi:hypothetical protein
MLTGGLAARHRDLIDVDRRLGLVFVQGFVGFENVGKDLGRVSHNGSHHLRDSDLVRREALRRFGGKFAE